jgi:phosphoribosyl-ATP pyrophosphohydrolase
MSDPNLGEELTRLWETIEARKDADPETSWTAKLLAGGPETAAKKMGEEAIEAVIAVIGQDKSEIASETADLLYHVLVTLAATGVDPSDVAAALAARAGTSGIEEKASRKK